ncbi:uncharacterized protein [Mytilus edulis]|uniref:uncharacterized protein n=1 Tax=Mytilus edulis TaxID=6550 RepID=UPI0039EEC44D
MPPYKNVYYRKYDIDVFDNLQEHIEMFSNIGNVAVIGDLNGRVGQEPDNITGDVIDKQLQDNISFINYVNDDVFLNRHSEDIKPPNNFGQRILQLCKNSGLRICNGRFGKESQKITFNNKNGCSVIDYMLISQNIMFNVINSFSVGSFNHFSCHAPLEVDFNLTDNVVNKDQCNCINHVCDIFKWNEGCEDQIRDSLLLNAQQFEHLLTNIDEISDIDCCVEELNKLLKDIFEQYTKSEVKYKKHCDSCPTSSKTRDQKDDKPWFTDECKSLYRDYLRAMMDFNRYRSNENRLHFNLAKQRYKRLENQLKRQYKNQQGDMLSKLHVTTEDQQSDSIPEVVYEELDSPFTDLELDTSIKYLKRDKSTGYDNIMNEYILTSRNFIKPVLCKLFNRILSAGDFPEIWVNNIIIPVFKKGPVDDPGNYRGISLVSHVGKLFTSIINTRLTKWSEKHNIITDAQFGFKPGYGTTDAIFALHSLISKSLRSGKRFYCCFIDYKKAFDSVSHFKLWLRLIRCGISGNLLTVIKSMYAKIKCCIKLEGNFSNFFQSNVGLMQGESLSPFLYSLYINDIENELLSQGCQSYELKMLNLYLLMYADDTVLFSETVDGLQKMIDSVDIYSREYDLDINLSKTKIVVFRNRGLVKATEKWYLNDVDIELCDEFTYLGLLFKYNGNFVHTQKMLANQGRKALFSLYSKIYDDCFNHETMLSLFDTYVSSILNYSCEVWGHHKAENIEKVHLSFLKRILKVKTTTVNYMVYSELGRYPLYIERYCRMLRYWFKLLKTDNCILQSCYQEMLERSILKPRDKQNWACEIRNILFRYGCQDVWLHQNVINVDHFLLEIVNRMKGSFVSEMNAFFNESSKCNFYRYIHDPDTLQFYLQKPVNYVFKPYISRYRLSAHCLNIETGRFCNIERENRLCNMCNKNMIEDEYHYILQCEKYSDIRKTYIKPFYWKKPSSYKLVQLLSVHNIKELNNLGKYLYLADKIRYS